MADAGRHEANRRRWLPLALVVLGVALLLATRAFHRVPGLGNADIAGILYEADIIVDGGVPYRDTMDMKSPGTWFLFAAIFRCVAREIAAVQAVFTGWCLLAAPAIWLAARALYGAREYAGWAVLLYLAAIGLFDLNYSAWMTTPYAWAFACLVLGLRGGRRGWHVLGGLFAAVAVVFKPHAFVLAPIFVMVWWWSRRRGDVGARWSAWLAWIVGALLGLAPLLLWYWHRGALPQLIAGLFPLEVAREYGERSLGGEEWWGWRAGKVPLQLLTVYPLHAVLAVATLLGCRRARADGRSFAPLLPAVVFLAWSVVGCGVGGLRFYIHYLPQYLPGLALLAAHPEGSGYLRKWRGELAGRETWIPGVLAATCVLLAVVLTIQIPLGKAARVDHKGNAQAKLAGEYIAARTGPDDTVQVWGWTAWSVYFWADRRAPSPVFKVLGQATDYNQNGMFSRSKRVDFRPGPAADTLLDAFKNAPPAFFVRAVPFFPGAREDPLEQWTELAEIVAEKYVMRQRFGKLRVYELRSRLTAGELKTVKREVPAKARAKLPRQRER